MTRSWSARARTRRRWQRAAQEMRAEAVDLEQAIARQFAQRWMILDASHARPAFADLIRIEIHQVRMLRWMAADCDARADA